MKKLYFLLLSFFILSAFGFDSYAKSLTVEWNNPGSVKFKVGSLGADTFTPAADLTSYTFEEAPSYLVIMPADGFALVKGSNNSTNPNYKNCNVQLNATYGQLISCSYYESTLTSMGDKPTLTIETAKVNRDKTFTIDIENGASCVNAIFTSMLMYSPALTNGSNTVHFSPEFDTDLNVNLIPGLGATTIYKVELNGNAIAYNRIYDQWQIGAIKEGDKLTIRVFEGEEPVIEDVTLTLDVPQGAITAIRNVTAAKFLDVPADGKLTFPEGSSIRIMFNTEDFEYISFSLDGKDITSKYNQEFGSIQFTVDKTSTFKVEAEEIIWPDITLTGYIMNPEGVRLNLGYFETENQANLSDGTPITSDLSFTTTLTYQDEELGTVTKMETYVLNASLTKSFKINVNSKRPNIFVMPKEGYYIKVVLGWDEGEYKEVNYVACDLAQAKSYTFYVIAEKYETDAKLDVNLLGDYKVRILPDTRMSQQWNNPTVEFSLHKGIQTLDFLASYSLPLTCGPAEQFNNIEAFYNGVALLPDDSNAFTVPYDKPSDPTLIPMLTINNTGKIQSQGNLKIEGEDNATITYGPTKTPAEAPYAYLVGTTINIKPSDPALSVAVNGAPIEATDGVYTFAVAKNINTVLIAENAGVEAVAAEAPALSYDGATVSAPGAEIEIFSLTGARIAKAHASFDATRLPAGIYIVRAAGHTLKIIRR